MDIRLIVSQTCEACFDVLTHIQTAGLVPYLKKMKVYIEFINGNNEFAIKTMERSLQWLINNVDRELFEDQESATPILTFIDEGMVTSVVAGSEEVIARLNELRELVKT